ncbi:Uncharacterised protein [uncultured archaeon]|nr:Uncharacterised protein [uncultured archaeon]
MAMEALLGLIGNLNMLTNLLLGVVLLVSVGMIAYPEPSVRHNGLIAFLITLLAAALTNIPISVV